jgi:phosphoglucosamine mutase
MSTAPRLFGTDGIRGPVGEFPLDRGTVEQLGLRLGEALAEENPHPQIVIGGDTRGSTTQLAEWLSSGLTSVGVISRFAGVLPTPGVALLTRRLDLDAGVAISASHNPHPDNGIKLFDRHGFKWSRAAESRLEHALVYPADAPSPVSVEIDATLDEF